MGRALSDAELIIGHWYLVGGLSGPRFYCVTGMHDGLVMLADGLTEAQSDRKSFKEMAAPLRRFSYPNGTIVAVFHECVRKGVVVGMGSLQGRRIVQLVLGDGSWAEKVEVDTKCICELRDVGWAEDKQLKPTNHGDWVEYGSMPVLVSRFQEDTCQILRCHVAPDWLEFKRDLQPVETRYLRPWRLPKRMIIGQRVMTPAGTGVLGQPSVNLNVWEVVVESDHRHLLFTERMLMPVEIFTRLHEIQGKEELPDYPQTITSPGVRLACRNMVDQERGGEFGPSPLSHLFQYWAAREMAHDTVLDSLNIAKAATPMRKEPPWPTFEKDAKGIGPGGMVTRDGRPIGRVMLLSSTHDYLDILFWREEFKKLAQEEAHAPIRSKMEGVKVDFSRQGEMGVASLRDAAARWANFDPTTVTDKQLIAELKGETANRKKTEQELRGTIAELHAEVEQLRQKLMLHGDRAQTWWDSLTRKKE